MPADALTAEHARVAIARHPGLIESASILRAWSAVGTLSPTAAGAGLLGACALTLASAWVVWRNVLAPAQQVAHADR